MLLSWMSFVAIVATFIAIDIAVVNGNTQQQVKKPHDHRAKTNLLLGKTLLIELQQHERANDHLKSHPGADYLASQELDLTKVPVIVNWINDELACEESPLCNVPDRPAGEVCVADITCGNSHLLSLMDMARLFRPEPVDGAAITCKVGDLRFWPCGKEIQDNLGVLATKAGMDFTAIG